MTTNDVNEAPRVLRIGTRGSPLAVAQTSMIARQLEEITGLATEIIRVTTTGDVSRATLSSLGGTGVFASELRDALLAGECDLVVHSLKDLPTAKAPGLTIGAYPEREDVRDALCSAGGPEGLTLADLPQGAKVGTGSPRRIAQLKRARPDLDVHDIRGNVDRRLGFVTDGELDAVVLASAGLERVGRTQFITERFDIDAFPTAPGQGCLAVEIRDGETIPGVSELDDPIARATVLLERGVLSAVEAGCHAPLGARATYADGELRCAVSVYSLDGTRALHETGTTRIQLDDLKAGTGLAEIDSLAQAIAAELLAQGAAELIAV